MKKKIFKILLTDSELIYMDIIWNNSDGINSLDLYNAGIDCLRSQTASLLHKIGTKGFIRYEKAGRHYVYYPTISKDDYKKIVAHLEVANLSLSDINMPELIASFSCNTSDLIQ